MPGPLGDLPWQAWMYGLLLLASLQLAPALFLTTHYTPEGPLRTQRLKAMGIMCLVLLVTGVGLGVLLSMVHMALTLGLLLATLAAPYAVIWQYRKLALSSR